MWNSFEIFLFSSVPSLGNLEGGMTTFFGNVSQVLRFIRQYSQIRMDLTGDAPRAAVTFITEGD